jgi:hypothetical protein
MDIAPFAGIQTRFRGVASRPRDKRERKFICSAHCSKERLVILGPPYLSDSFRRHIPDPLPDRDRPAGVAAR